MPPKTATTGQTCPINRLSAEELVTKASSRRANLSQKLYLSTDEFVQKPVVRWRTCAVTYVHVVVPKASCPRTKLFQKSVVRKVTCSKNQLPTEELVPKASCQRTHLSQKPVVRGRPCPKSQLSKDELVPKASCPRTNFSQKPVVNGRYCPKSQLSADEHVPNASCQRTNLSQKSIVHGRTCP